MANAMFSFGEFNLGGVEDKLSSTYFESMEEESIGGKQVYEPEHWGGFGALCSSDYGFSDFTKYQQQDQQQSQLISDHGVFDDMQFQFSALSPSLQACFEEIAKLENIPTLVPHVEPPKKEKRDFFFVAGLDLLNNYGSGFKRLNGERIVEMSNPCYATCTEVESSKLSTEEIVRVAGARFIRTASQVFDIPSMLSHPFELSFAGLSDDESRDVELVEFLLASAEKVAYQQYERASKLLNLCDMLSSDRGNPVQRLVFYFCEALREKIDRETGRTTQNKQSFDMDKTMRSPNETSLACHKKIPFSQVAQFAGIQAIVEKVAEAKKVHVIDLEIRTGVQWTVLMQALASRDLPLELLKISAVGTTCKESIQNTGKWLESFAKTMNVPFSFKMVMVPDMLDLKEDMFELDSEEAVAVYCQFVLSSMVPQPDRLESVMRVIKNIHPCLIVVTEVEANHNSPVFVTRFIEALFFFSAYFDCVETCIEQNSAIRKSLESQYFGNGIKNIVASEGDERKIRHVKIDVWRAFFLRYGMEEIELSSSSLYQAELVTKNFPCGSSCTISMDGKCLLAGWKGTPLQSLSLWKFV